MNLGLRILPLMRSVPISGLYQRSLACNSALKQLTSPSSSTNRTKRKYQIISCITIAKNFCIILWLNAGKNLSSAREEDKKELSSWQKSGLYLTIDIE